MTPRTRRLLRLLAAAAVGATAAALLAPGLRSAAARERPAPLWSAADLPALPEASANGWLAFRAEAAALPDDRVPRELEELLLRLDWTRARELKNQLLPLAGNAGLRARYAAARAALAAPRFADACGLDLEADCQHLRASRLHDLVVAGALVRALAGRWTEAFEAAGDLLRADLDLLRTSRTVLSAGLAQQRVHDDLGLVGVLLDGLAREAPRRSAELQPARARLAALLAQPVEPAAACRRAVIAEYVHVTGFLRTVAGAQDQRHPYDWVGSLYLDPDQTLALLNGYFEPLARYAESPSTRPPPPFPRFTRQRFGWWAYNAKGRLVLDGALADWSAALRQLEARGAELAAAQAQLRARLAT